MYSVSLIVGSSKVSNTVVRHGLAITGCVNQAVGVWISQFGQNEYGDDLNQRMEIVETDKGWRGRLNGKDCGWAVTVNSSAA